MNFRRKVVNDFVFESFANFNKFVVNLLRRWSGSTLWYGVFNGSLYGFWRQQIVLDLLLRPDVQFDIPLHCLSVTLRDFFRRVIVGIKQTVGGYRLAQTIPQQHFQSYFVLPSTPTAY